MRMKRLASIAALLGSSATLVCCVLPAFFVTLGFGATFAGIVGAFPQLIWLSEHKGIVFGGAALLLAVAGVFQWRNRYVVCPTDPRLAEACTTTRSWSRKLFFVSLFLYVVGAFFAFAAGSF